MTTLIVALSLLISGPAPATPQTAVARAGWLAGCWHLAGERGNPSIRLYWTRASNELLVGTWMRLPLGLEPEYSFLRIESGPALALIWQAPGERPITMPVDPAVRLSADAIAFVNQGTGDPKRVEFRRGKDETLLIKLSNALDDGAPALEPPMKKCG